MQPGLILLVLGVQFVLTVGLSWMMFRLGGFTLTSRERRWYPIVTAGLIVWALLLAFIGPLPLPVVLAMNVVTLGLFVWAWRTGRFSIERVPTDFQAEAKRRRQWMREHRRLLTGLFAGYMVVSIAWPIALLLVLSQRG